MLNKSYIEQRAEQRLEIERQVSEFLSRGGKIDVRQPGESSFVEGPSNCETRSAEQARRAHVMRFASGEYYRGVPSTQGGGE